MMTGMLHDQNLEKEIEKQMGCMTGFLQLFDRHQILTGKRLYNTKRLSHYPVSDSASQSERSMDSSPAHSRELRPLQQKQEQRTHSVTPEIRSPVPEVPTRSPLHLPVFEFKEGLRSSWKFKEAPRLSLDSRATVDGKGSLYPKEIRTNAAIFSANRVKVNEEENDKQKRSPSVIAKLMGLEALPDSGREPMQKVELRRSASESRVSKDLRFMDGNSFQVNHLQQPKSARENVVPNVERLKGRTPDLNDYRVRKPVSESQRAPNGYFGGGGGGGGSSWKPQQQQRKSYFDAQDFYPEPKQNGLYGEIEKRLKMRGIDEPAKDLETLKQILEALQLKGLLHSNRAAEEQQSRNRSNIIFDRNSSGEESPIVLMKPSRSTVSVNRIGRSDSAPNPRSKPVFHRNLSGEHEQPGRFRRDQIDRGFSNQRFGRPSNQNESSDKSPSSLSRRRQNPENQRRTNEATEQKRNSPVNSPRIGAKKSGSDQMTTSKSPRNRRSTAEISPKERLSSHTEDESSTISESSRSTSSQIDSERTKMGDYKEGRSLLARCDKLLNSIAEITAASNTAELQPSPVSVLDSSFYKDESSPSPVMKRCIDFKDGSVELDDQNWSPAISPVRLKFNDKTEDCDFLYVSEILRASNILSEDTDVFLLLEKHQYKANSSEASRLHRKLIFDIITEILHKKKQLPPWKAFSSAVSVTGQSSLEQIWSEFRRIRERDQAEDLFEVIFGVLRKDMAGDATNGWSDCQMETSEAVLDIERLIFKDLVGETIRDLAAFSGRNRGFVSRRKLVF